MFALNEYLIVISFSRVNNCKEHGWIIPEKSLQNVSQYWVSLIQEFFLSTEP
jgi:hypothetical protein